MNPSPEATPDTETTTPDTGTTTPDSETAAPASETTIHCPVERRMLWVAAFLVLLVGTALRLWPSTGFHKVGYDEMLYRDYMAKLDKVGLSEYPVICQVHIEDQRRPKSGAKLPPTRFLYIYTSWLWKRAQYGDTPIAAFDRAVPKSADPAFVSLKRVAALATILLMVTSGVMAWRMRGPAAGVGVLALMAAAPVQIHMSQHGLIDGFFALWATLALWTTWENLRQPNHNGWLFAQGVAIALMVLTKENAFFVFVALAAIVATNRWTKLGTVTPKLLLASVLGGLFAMLLLVSLAGGVSQWIEIYQLLVSKAQVLPYAIETGDGPWHRYLIDYMTMSPVVLCLALGAIYTAWKQNRGALYLSAFIFFSYLIMCNVRYGMNLRYSTIWDMPLRLLALIQIFSIARAAGRREVIVATSLVAALCLYELRQYQIFFMDSKLYELASAGLLHAVKILK